MSDQERKVYSFKSVGETQTDREVRNQARDQKIPLGIKTPMSLGNNHSGIFDMHIDLADQIRDNFRNMISTNHGDRLMLRDFGANLFPLAFELGTEQIDALALQRITATTEKYMPYVSLETFEPFSEASESGGVAKAGVRITYSVPSINVENQVIEAIIFAAG